MAWVRASSPDAAVTAGGSPRVRSGSTMATAASRRWLTIPALSRRSVSSKMALGVTSLPVPAVVGMRIVRRPGGRDELDAEVLLQGAGVGQCAGRRPWSCPGRCRRRRRRAGRRPRRPARAAAGRLEGPLDAGDGRLRLDVRVQAGGHAGALQQVPHPAGDARPDDPRVGDDQDAARRRGAGPRPRRAPRRRARSAASRARGRGDAPPGSARAPGGHALSCPSPPAGLY